MDSSKLNNSSSSSNIRFSQKSSDLSNEKLPDEQKSKLGFQYQTNFKIIKKDIKQKAESGISGLLLRAKLYFTKNKNSRLKLYKNNDDAKKIIYGNKKFLLALQTFINNVGRFPLIARDDQKKIKPIGEDYKFYIDSDICTIKFQYGAQPSSNVFIFKDKERSIEEWRELNLTVQDMIQNLDNFLNTNNQIDRALLKLSTQELKDDKIAKYIKMLRLSDQEIFDVVNKKDVSIINKNKDFGLLEGHKKFIIKNLTTFWKLKTKELADKKNMLDRVLLLTHIETARKDVCQLFNIDLKLIKTSNDLFKLLIEKIKTEFIRDDKTKKELLEKYCLKYLLDFNNYDSYIQDDATRINEEINLYIDHIDMKQVRQIFDTYINDEYSHVNENQDSTFMHNAMMINIYADAGSAESIKEYKLEFTTKLKLLLMHDQKLKKDANILLALKLNTNQKNILNYNFDDYRQYLANKIKVKNDDNNIDSIMTGILQKTLLGKQLDDMEMKHIRQKLPLEFLEDTSIKKAHVKYFIKIYLCYTYRIDCPIQNTDFYKLSEKYFFDKSVGNDEQQEIFLLIRNELHLTGEINHIKKTNKYLFLMTEILQKTLNNDLLNSIIGFMKKVPQVEDMENKDFIVYKNANNQITFYVKNDLGEPKESESTIDNTEFCQKLNNIDDEDGFKLLIKNNNKYHILIQNHINQQKQQCKITELLSLILNN